MGPPGCARCGSPLQADQEWCLECGSAATIIHPPPDWRIPVLVVSVIVLAAAAAFVIALSNLGDPGGPAHTPAAATHHSAKALTPAAGVARRRPIASWPAGLSGWTVVLARTSDQPTANAAARGLADGGISVGVLDSAQHPLLKRQGWFVFSGRYPDQAQAQAAAARLSASGQHPSVVEVAAPGGI